MKVFALLPLHDKVEVAEVTVEVREMLAGFKVQSIPKVGKALKDSVTAPTND
jgi:hypothetical protein